MLKHGEGLRARSQPRSLAPSIVKRTGPPSPLVLPFLRFCHLRGNSRREGKEKERGEITITPY